MPILIQINAPIKASADEFYIKINNEDINFKNDSKIYNQIVSIETFSIGEDIELKIDDNGSILKCEFQNFGTGSSVFQGESFIIYCIYYGVNPTK